MTIQTSILSNGVRIVTDFMPQVETVSLGVWLDVGARYETLRQNGISHLLEHLAFKGTHSRSAKQLAEEIEAVGGYLNAYTSREHTTYYARLMKDDLPLALDILSDIVLNATYRSDELSREKDVIVQEIGQVRDTPDDLVFECLQEAAYPDQPLGRSILGTADRVRQFDSQGIRKYMQRHYRAEATVLAAAGNLDHDQLAELAAAAFGEMRVERSEGFLPAKFEGGYRHEVRELEQMHLALGFPATAFDDPDYFAQQVLTTILGVGMSSRLFQEVRENRGLAYSVYAFSSAHADTGLMGIYAGTDPSLVGKLLPVIADEMKKMAVKVKEDELFRAKSQLKAGLLMSLESTPSRIEQLGRQMLIFGRAIPIEELIANVDGIALADITRLAARFLEGPLAFAAVGQSEHVPSEAELCEMFCLPV
jgi:predicted Zn-dependent peptidase